MDKTAYSNKLLELMKAANRKGASLLLEEIITEGCDYESIITEILDPALVNIGILWGKQTISLAQAFVGAKIAEDVFQKCISHLKNPENFHSKGIVVIGNIEDDFHSLGRRMITSFLMAAGWEVVDLGNDVLAEEFIDKALEVGASVIGVSAMMQTTALNIRKVRDLIDSRGLQNKLKLAVGGAVFNWRPELVDEVGGDGTATNAASVDALFLKLQAEITGEVHK